MPDWCDECGRTLRLADWQTMERIDGKLMQLCEDCWREHDDKRPVRGQETERDDT